MRNALVTYKGAYHHIMNRGIIGADIFLGDKAKYYFLVKYSSLGFLYKRISERVWTMNGYFQDDKHRSYCYYYY